MEVCHLNKHHVLYMQRICNGNIQGNVVSDNDINFDKDDTRNA